MKTVVSVLVAIAAFFAGCFIALRFSFLLFQPPPNCPSPCDGPAYVALAFTMLIGPIFGLIGAFVALRILWRWRSKRLTIQP